MTDLVRLVEIQRPPLPFSFDWRVLEVFSLEVQQKQALLEALMIGCQRKGSEDEPPAPSWD